ncbi:MAG: hypothetical protein JW751_32035 [Polyangiaceae bacterium]|nr:hypothetical protein [Polyangiaceae bacterium]
MLPHLGQRDRKSLRVQCQKPDLDLLNGKAVQQSALVFCGAHRSLLFVAIAIAVTVTGTEALPVP